jgi:hypothetical protein
MVGEVFISYSRADYAYTVRLAEHIHRHGLVVNFDSSIERDDAWQRWIESAIGQCGAFILLMSPASERSEWVLREINRARDMGRPILPILLAGRPIFPLMSWTMKTRMGRQCHP